MLSRLKQMVPLSVRQEIKRQMAAREDRRDPITTPRVPPRAETLIGGGDFEHVGDEFFDILKRHGLSPDMQILDVGCGQGRMARPMVGFLTNGSYQGFDISSDGIDWCQLHYADQPNFQFIHIPVYNKRYNPGGAVQASDFVFPYEDERFDLVFLTSVFTHMFADDVRQYLAQIQRVLKPGGKALITWFLLNEKSLSAENPILNFAFEFDDVSRTTTPKTPEAALAFDEGFVRGLYEELGLSIETVEYGHWAQADSTFQLQDMVVAVK